MIPIKTTNAQKVTDLISFINDYLRLIVNEINHNIRPNFVQTYYQQAPQNPKDGMIGYFPCRPATPDRPADVNPGLGQGKYIYLLNYSVEPVVGKWHKFNTTPTP